MMRRLNVASLRTKLFLAFFLLTAFIAAIIAYVLFVHMRTNHLDTIKRDLRSITALAAMQLEDLNLEYIFRQDMDLSPERQQLQQLLKRITSKDIGIEGMVIIRQSDQLVIAVGGKDANENGLAREYKDEKIPTEAHIQTVVVEEDTINQVKNIKAYTSLRNRQGDEVATLVTTVNGAAVAQDFQHFAWRIFSVASGAVIVAALFSWWLARNFSRRLHNLHSALDQMAKGKLDISLAVDGQDEVSDLAARINSLAAALHGEREEMLLAAIESLVTALEAKDEYTFGHSSQVSDIAVLIARQLGLPETEIFTIRVAALLHDVGKIGIPDRVLHKNDRLNDEEWELIKQHPLIGTKIVSGIPALEHVADIVKHHHARWDGKGYPENLLEQEIPLGARIIAVADTFQAMTSDRPYRKGMAAEAVMGELRLCSGFQFDKEVVTAFEQVFHKIM